MHRIDHSTAVAALPAPGEPGTPGYFTEGDPVGGIPATVVTQAWANAIQEELIAVVEAGDLTPDKDDNAQLLAAIRSIATSASVQGAVKNLKASATGTNASTSVTVDEITLESATNSYVVARAVALTINAAASGANGLDAGTLAASTWYSVWVIWDGTTISGLLSLSATAPTLPAGYTHKARVGWLRTDATANKYPLSFTQAGKSVRYKVAAGSNVATLPALAAGVQGSITTPTWVAAGVSAVTPPTAGAIAVVVSVSAVNSVVIVAPNSSYGAYSAAVNPPPLSVFTQSGGGVTNIQGLFNLESASIYVAILTAGLVQCFGWEDNL